MGDQGEAPAASSSTVDMEAAEQLIQLSGGRDEAGGSGGGAGESESRSVDSVKAAAEERGDGGKEGVQAVVESRSADSVKAGEERRDGDKEGVPAVVESSSAGKRSEKPGAEKARVDDDEAVMGGVVRRRPRFRSLAAIYRQTKRIDLVPCREEAEEGGSSKGKEKTKKKRAAGGAADDEAAPSKARRVAGTPKKQHRT